MTADADLDLLIRAERAVTSEGLGPLMIGVRDGRFSRVDEPVNAATEIVLGADEVLLPGLVDTHVHINEPGRTDWEGFASATAAAAAGGVTTLLDMPLNSIPPTIDVSALKIKTDVARDQLRVDVGFWGGAVPDNLGTLRALHDQGVYGFKCFLSTSGVDEFPRLDHDQLRAALTEVSDFGGLLIVHAEDPMVLAERRAGGPHYTDFLASRPDEAETAAIARVIAGVRESGARVHLLHLSSAAALPMLREAKQEGLPITVETCPHYLIFAAETIADGATEFKCCPPIRDRDNQDQLWQGLLDGTIDCIVSDHSPSTAELKLDSDGDFGRAWGGISGLQVGLSAVWTEARRRGIGLGRVIDWMAAAPARVAGLTDRGLIVDGSPAHFVIFAPDTRWRVDARNLLHKNKISAYDGLELSGVVRSTWLYGAKVDLGGERRGRLLKRSERA